MENHPVASACPPSVNPASRAFPAPFRLRGHALSLAREVAELEACLSLERSLGANREDSEGLDGPAAIPYCDFLMLRDGEGALAGVCRFLAHGPGIPVKNPLASDRFQRSPLLTALRYSRRRILEVGPILVGPGRDPLRVTALVWDGILRILEKEGSVILLGLDRIPLAARLDLAPVLAEHGLPPDLETEARKDFRKPASAAAGMETAGRGMPESLQEALRRGCCLATEPTLSPDRAALEIVWMALPEVLGAPPDWRA